MPIDAKNGKMSFGRILKVTERDETKDTPTPWKHRIVMEAQENIQAGQKIVFFTYLSRYKMHDGREQWYSMKGFEDDSIGIPNDGSINNSVGSDANKHFQQMQQGQPYRPPAQQNQQIQPNNFNQGQFDPKQHHPDIPF